MRALWEVQPSPSTPVSALQPVLTLALNQLAEIRGLAVVVLDDLHRVTAREVYELLSYALEHLPGNARLVLSTRVDPALPAARLRAAGQMVEIRTSDLRFTTEESDRFLASAVPPGLDGERLHALEAKSEGWIAGLRMAGLALAASADPAGFVDGFTGSDRFILEYLSEEVLDRQEDTVKEFLLQTSILDRLSAPLCGAVTGRDDAAEVLQTVWRRNLFLSPLDSRNEWFHWHALFSDLLRALLKQRHPELLPVLHRRAALWHERNALPDEAFRHAVAAGDGELAAEVLLTHAGPLLFGGWVTTVQRWLDLLPDEGTRGDIRVCLMRCLVSFFRNRWLELEALLDRTEELCRGALSAVGEGRANDVAARARASIAILRSFVAYQKDDLDSAVALAREAADAIGTDDLRLQGLIWSGLGFALQERGDLEHALQAFEKASTFVRADGNMTASAILFQRTVEVRAAQGRLEEAWRICQDGLDALRDKGIEGLPSSGHVYSAAAEVLFLRGGSDAARENWEKASALAQYTGDLGAMKLCVLGQARLLASAGRTQEALEAVRGLEEAARSSGSLPTLREIDALRATIRARAGHREEVLSWMRDAGQRDVTTFTGELQGIALVRALICADRSAEALEMSSRLLSAAETGGRGGRALSLLCLQALAHESRGNREEALAVLRRAVDLAAPEGALQVFIEEGRALGPAVSELLGRLQRVSAARGSRARAAAGFVRAVAEGIAAQNGSMRQRPQNEPAAEERPREALTAREQEILVLLAAGNSNQEIAEKLFVSMATAKKHVSAILGKLGVANRTRAAAVARRLGLL
jgi:LuxR family maltose regulon positive regulatory protein